MKSPSNGMLDLKGPAVDENRLQAGRSCADLDFRNKEAYIVDSSHHVGTRT